MTRHPAVLLTRLSREVYAENAGGSYLTCIIARLDSASRTLTYANAGHPSGVLVGPLGRRLLSRGGPPAGLFAETTYETEILAIADGDLGVLVIDGITEAIDKRRAATGDVLTRAIDGSSEPHTPDGVCKALTDLAHRSRGPYGIADWQDDRTVLAFQFDGAI